MPILPIFCVHENPEYETQYANENGWPQNYNLHDNQFVILLNDWGYIYVFNWFSQGL